jgi:hypothetical protein
MPANYPNPFEITLPGQVLRKLTFGEVKEIIDRHDPMELLSIGAPSDEYGSEIQEIVQRRNWRDAVLDQAEILDIFGSWFYHGCISEEKASAIAQDLANLPPVQTR